MANQNNSGEFFAGFIVGGLLGAAIALLLAPQSGEETRAQIMEKSDEFKNVAGEGLADSRARADAILNDARARAESIVIDAKGKAENIQAQAKLQTVDLKAKGKTAIDEQTGKLKDLAASLAEKVKKSEKTDADASAEA